MTDQDLKNILHRIHQKGFKAYQEIKGTFHYADFALTVFTNER